MSTCVCSVCESFCDNITELPRLSLCVHVSGCLSMMMCIWCVSRGMGTSMFLDRCVYVFFNFCMWDCPSVVRFGWCLHRSLGFWDVCVSVCLTDVCVCVDVQMHVCVQGQGCMSTYRSHSEYTCCLRRASHLFSWFCFSPPHGLQTPLENKGSLKSAALPVFPNVQNAAVSSRGASLDAQPCHCRRKPPACWATTTHLHKPLGGAWARGRGP